MSHVNDVVFICNSMAAKIHEDVQRVVAFIILVVLFQIAIARWGLEREAKRRWQHALTGQALVLVSYYLPVVSIGLPALLVGAVGIYYVRYYQVDLYEKTFGPLLRPNELAKDSKQLPGAFYFIVGSAFTVAIFPLDVARYAVLCLSWADPIAAWVGRSFPIHKIHRSASVGGCTACFATAVIIGCFSDFSISISSNSMHDFSLAAPLVGAVACTVAEASPIGNDNLLIPLVTGSVMHCMLQI